VQKGKRKSKKLKCFKDGKNGESDTNFNHSEHFIYFKDSILNDGNDNRQHNNVYSKQLEKSHSKKKSHMYSTSANNKGKSKKLHNINTIKNVHKNLNNVINICDDCSIAEMGEDKAASASEGESVQYEGHSEVIQGKVLECAHYDGINECGIDSDCKNISQISLINRGIFNG
jgi:hypothetical protein